MRSLKTLALAGVSAVVLAAAASAADHTPSILTAPPSVGAPAAAAETTGWYLRGDIGVGMNALGRFNALTDVGGVATPQPLAGTTWALRSKSVSEAVSIGLGAGYSFNSWLRADVTIDYRAGARMRALDFATWSPNPMPVGQTGPSQLTNSYNGDIRSIVALFNAYADLGTFCALGCLTPYVGAGVGVAQNMVMNFTDQGAGLNPGLGPFVPLGAYARTSAKTNFAWALMAGLGYRVNERVALELGYRYLNMGDLPTMRLVDAITNTNTPNQIRVRQYSAHEIRMGMRWMLNSDCCGAAPSPIPVIARN